MQLPREPGTFSQSRGDADGTRWVALELAKRKWQKCEFQGQRSLSQGLRLESGWGLWEDPRHGVWGGGGWLGWLQIKGPRASLRSQA